MSFDGLQDRSLRVLLLGNGGREHAIAYYISKSRYLQKLFCYERSDAIVLNCGADYLDLSRVINDEDALIGILMQHGINLVIIGPEKYLVAGISDIFRRHGIACFGPGSGASMLEGAKSFTRRICSECGIPSPKFEILTKQQVADIVGNKKALSFGLPFVIKFDRLAAGKGVYMIKSYDEAMTTLSELLARAGDFTSNEVLCLIEQELVGPEVSLFILCDDYCFKVFATAQDYKRLSDSSLSPNTGGMGCFSPQKACSDEVIAEAVDQIVAPTLAYLKSKGVSYQGVLYAGLMIVGSHPYLIEYNIRFGDSECQAILPRLRDDFLLLCYLVANNRLKEIGAINFSDDCAVNVVMAACGYPSNPVKGDVIENLAKYNSDGSDNGSGALLFHSGTEFKNSCWHSKGGRVLSFTATAQDLQIARDKCYNALTQVNLRGAFYRKDIAKF